MYYVRDCYILPQFSEILASYLFVNCSLGYFCPLIDLSLEGDSNSVI